MAVLHPQFLLAPFTAVQLPFQTTAADGGGHHYLLAGDSSLIREPCRSRSQGHGSLVAWATPDTLVPLARAHVPLLEFIHWPVML